MIVIEVRTVATSRAVFTGKWQGANALCLHLSSVHRNVDTCEKSTTLYLKYTSCILLCYISIRKEKEEKKEVERKGGRKEEGRKKGRKESRTVRNLGKLPSW